MEYHAHIYRCPVVAVMYRCSVMAIMYRFQVKQGERDPGSVCSSGTASKYPRFT